MKTNNEKGRTLAVFIGIYLIVKAVVNMVIGGGFDLIGTVSAVAMVFLLISGQKYMNYAVCLVLAITVADHIVYNLTNLPGTLIYVIEAALDLGCIVLLLAHKDIREHFTNPWTVNK